MPKLIILIIIVVIAGFGIFIFSQKNPDKFLWGTDRGDAKWNYDPEVSALIEEYSRTFIGQLDQTVQEKYAYKNAEALLQKR